MANNMNKEKRLVYALIANIPSFYHASDLRNYFSQFLERNGFDCFHFRHRPEIVKCKPSVDSINVGVSHDDATQSKRGRTMCCVVRVNRSQCDELIKMYNRKCWLDRKGESIKSVCRITLIKIAADDDSAVKFKTRGETKCKKDEDQRMFTCKDLSSLPELHPPALMPNGNVGTSTSYFLKQIQLCRLPSSIIGKLGLVFPRTRSNRQYGSVPFVYRGTELCEGSSEDFTDIISGKGESILSENEMTNVDKIHDSNVPAEDNVDEVKNDNADSESDADECEEWERHEAFHDDPSNQGRDKERLYEEEMEIVWEKGGPGIVWYTDAQFWDELNGTEEEKDVDEWDIDMSVYYDEDGGDKDARDMLTMRRDIRRREGRSDDAIGYFERHTKGIGRKLMTKYGWRDGKGLGSSVIGITDALDDEGGQKPSDKRGFGYHGEKLQVFGGQSMGNRYTRPKEVDESKPVISTIYDKPSQTDPDERLLRRLESTQLKHRQHLNQQVNHKRTKLT